MSREGRRALVATVALLAAVTLATAATFALRRPGRTAAPATITANDPT
ncbi:MAG: hypothetical protein JWP87_1849, partial [Labilithrix sp.]|nr:hypothetical protein [Labilithrix sp.]